MSVKVKEQLTGRAAEAVTPAVAGAAAARVRLVTVRAGAMVTARLTQTVVHTATTVIALVTWQQRNTSPVNIAGAARRWHAVATIWQW